MNLVNTETMRITDTRTSVFIELRERGAEGVYALNKCGLQPTARPRGKPSRHAYSRFAATHGYNPKQMNVWSGVAPDTYVEMFYTRDSGLNVKPVKLHNVATPYFVIQGKPTAAHEVFLTMDAYSVVTTLDRRMLFTQQIYNLATETQNPMYLFSALECMKILFFTMAAAGKIPAELAEKTYNKYDGLEARLFRSNFPGEQFAAFNLAHRMLAKVTGMSVQAQS